jgi:hypothetical protein
MANTRETGYDKISLCYDTKQNIINNVSKLNTLEVAIATDTSELCYKDLNGALKTVKMVLPKLCPYEVGDILITSKAENPSLTYTGTTWNKIENRFLMGASSTYGLGTTGGVTSVSLTLENIPTHRHKVENHIHSQPSHTHPFVASKDGGNVGMGGGSWYRSNQNLTTSSAGGENTGGATPYTDYQGNGTEFSIIPVYMAVNIWKRAS